MPGLPGLPGMAPSVRRLIRSMLSGNLRCLPSGKEFASLRARSLVTCAQTDEPLVPHASSIDRQQMLPKETLAAYCSSGWEAALRREQDDWPRHQPRCQ